MQNAVCCWLYIFNSWEFSFSCSLLTVNFACLWRDQSSKQDVLCPTSTSSDRCLAQPVATGHAAGRAQILQNSRPEQICYWCCFCSFPTEIIHHSANTRNHMKNIQPKENDKSISNNDACCWGFDFTPKLNVFLLLQVIMTGLISTQLYSFFLLHFM